MKMGMRAVGMPKPVVWDMMTMAKASTMEPSMPPSVEAAMSPPVPRARLGIGCAPYKQQQDEYEYLDVFAHTTSPFIAQAYI